MSLLRDDSRKTLGRPFYIGTGDTAAFAVYHAAEADGEPRPPVLICPPWGWSDVSSYRARRDWAVRLAAAGFPTLRFDLPATGNSAGEVADAGIPAGWVAATIAAAGWLADADGGGTGIAALGLGLGGLLAMAAIAAGAPISLLALWGAPGRGKRFVRETQAFSRMQPWLGDEVSGDGFDPGVPDGWLEAGGFALSPETLADLKTISAEIPPGSSLTRALLLDRDGIEPDADLVRSLEGAEVDVERADGSGWENFVAHPELSVLPEGPAMEFERWLGAVPAATRPAEGRQPEMRETLTVEVEGKEVHETVLGLEQPWGETVGILAEGASADVHDFCAVFLNAGAVRSIGPNRLWAETARRWASIGVPSVRIDLQGIGEADGKPAGSLRLDDFYAERGEAQVLALLDELERREIGCRFILVGLCSGGYRAFRAAVVDPRVRAVLQVNAGALRWASDLPQQREAHRTSRALERRWWRRLLHGEIEPERIVRLLRSVALNAVRASRDSLARLFGRGPAGVRGQIESDLDVLRDRGTRVLIAFSGDEPLGEEVERYRLPEQGSLWPNVRFASLPGSDHTLRPFATQRAAAKLLDEELTRVTGLTPPARSGAGAQGSGEGPLGSVGGLP